MRSPENLASLIFCCKFTHWKRKGNRGKRKANRGKFLKAKNKSWKTVNRGKWLRILEIGEKVNRGKPLKGG